MKNVITRLSIITNHSFIKVGTSQINHIPHKSHSHKTHDSHKCTKSWKLEVIKLTYLETWKFKNLVHGCLNLLYHLLPCSNHQPSTTFCEQWAIYDEQTILWIRLPYMDNCGFITQRQYGLQKLWSSTMNTLYNFIVEASLN